MSQKLQNIVICDFDFLSASLVRLSRSTAEFCIKQLCVLYCIIINTLFFVSNLNFCDLNSFHVYCT